MQIFGTVVSKTITSNGVFARIKVKGLPKNGFMRFFDVEDVDNFQIGQPVGVFVTADPIDQAVNKAAQELGVPAPPVSLSTAYDIAEQVSREEGNALEHLGEGDYIDLHLSADGVYMPPSNPSADIVGATGVDYPPAVSTEWLDKTNQIMLEAEEETGRL